MARELNVLAEGFSFLEGPRWHEGRLWCSDFYTLRVLAVGPDGAVETVVGVPNQPSGLGWLPDGTLLVVSMRDRRLLRLVGGRLVEHADLFDLAGSHLNDMVVDDHGRAWVGNFGSDILSHEPIRTANLIRVDPDGSATVVAEDLHFPNGTVMTPDGSTLIVAETLGNRIAAFDIEADGSLTNRRDFARFGEPPSSDDLHKAIEGGELVVAPDGMTLDADGAVWAADALGARAVRVAGGEIVDEVSIAGLGLGVFACALGGDDGRTLHLMAAPTFEQEACKANHKAAIVTVRVDVPHAGRP